MKKHLLLGFLMIFSLSAVQAKVFFLGKHSDIKKIKSETPEYVECEDYKFLQDSFEKGILNENFSCTESFDDDVPELSEISSEIKLDNGVQLKLGHLSLWRDWQPMVSDPGKDGGSKLHVSLSMEVNNFEKEEKKMEWQVFLMDKISKNVYPLFLNDENGLVLNKMRIPPGEGTLYLSTYSGPYVPVDSEISVLFNVKDLNNRKWLRTQFVKVFRVD